MSLPKSRNATTGTGMMQEPTPVHVRSTCLAENSPAGLGNPLADTSTTAIGLLVSALWNWTKQLPQDPTLCAPVAARDSKSLRRRNSELLRGKSRKLFGIPLFGVSSDEYQDRLDAFARSANSAPGHMAKKRLSYNMTSTGIQEEKRNFSTLLTNQC